MSLQRLILLGSMCGILHSIHAMEIEIERESEQNIVQNVGNQQEFKGNHDELRIVIDDQRNILKQQQLKEYKRREELCDAKITAACFIPPIILSVCGCLTVCAILVYKLVT